MDEMLFVEPTQQEIETGGIVGCLPELPFLTLLNKLTNR